MIKRDLTKIPKPLTNPAASLIEDTIDFHQVSKAEASRAMNVTPQLLTNVIKSGKAVSVELAMRLELCFKLPATVLLNLQADYDYQVAYHKKGAALKQEVKAIA